MVTFWAGEGDAIFLRRFYIAFPMLPKSNKMPEGQEPPSGSEI